MVSALLVSLILLSVVSAQENAQMRVSRYLEECYRNEDLLERDNQLPMTIQTLIDLIRKIEFSSEIKVDMRQLAVSLLHRFRQDGIIRAPGVVASASVLPYSPAGFQFTKHKILMSRLISGNAHEFPNNTLNSRERCTLHFMLSSAIDKRVRGDEAQRCNQLAQFRAMRVPRDTINKSSQDKSNFLGDVEFLETLNTKIETKPSRKKAALHDHNGEMYPDEEGIQISTDYEGEHSFGGDIGLVDIANDAVSQCPVESGIISTPWGTINAGNLLAGIAAGLQPQKVQLRTLLALARRTGSRPSQQTDITVDNKWAATLAGDLAEAALMQTPTSQVAVGASGAWNSTTDPHWYFLTQRERLEMTDAEIRGGLDGLIIAMKIDEWRNMKLSQLLAMYYSQKGILDSGIRACDRRLLFTTYANPEQMKAQTIAFANVLNREILLRVTLYPDAIKAASLQAAEALSIYIPQSLNDLSCEATSPVPNDPTIWRTATDLFVYVDTTWTYREIGPVLSAIWPEIDIRPHGSSVTILNAMNSKIIVNTTLFMSSISDWNATSHVTFPAGFNLPSVLKSLQNLTMSVLENERRQSLIGGRSLIALIVVANGGVNGGDSNYASQKIQYLREQIPDLKILFMANGAINRFSPYVKDSAKDIYPIKIGDNPRNTANPVIKRIREIPRRIINPRCGSNWQAQGNGPSQITQYVIPGSVNYYRLHPNYFFKEASGRRLKIQGIGGSTITVCSSREVELPRANISKAEKVNCQNNFDIDLSNPCNGHSVIHSCPPLYISVEVKEKTGNNQVRCQDLDCAYPDEAPFQIQSENLGCFSGVMGAISSPTVTVTLLLVLSLVY